MIVAVIEAPTSQGGFIQPVAIIVNDAMAGRIAVEGQNPMHVHGAEDPERLKQEAIETGQSVGSLTGIGLVPPISEAESFATSINTMADHGARSTGGLTIHYSPEHDAWCGHVGPEPEGEGESKGCMRATFLEAMSHAVTDHAPAPGPPLLADDDPRATSHLN